jgi:hypothetical protein
LQAIALGRPTILTDAHGQASYAHLGIGIGTQAAPAEYFIYGDAGEWWEPSYDDLCEAMWDVYKNWGAHADQAKKSAAVVADEWTWSNVTDRFVDILGPEMTKPYTGDSTWRETSKKLYEIVTDRDWSCDIAGRKLVFDRGVSYWEPADVKRILFDAGLLDPVCCGPGDQGLTELQAAQLGAYRASHRTCPTCGQDLNAHDSESLRIELQMALDELADANARLEASV